MTASTTFSKTFLQKEFFGGLFLIAAMGLALFCANAPWSETYEAFWNAKIGFAFGETVWNVPFKSLIDEGLMALFFLLIGCELKRECLEGDLSSRAHIALPLSAAFGGMAAPAIFYVGTFFAAHLAGASPDLSLLRGWAVPTATDIAFAVGVLGFLGTRVPTGLKTFLVALAVFDDLGAIVLIGLFYTDTLHAHGLALLAAVSTILFFLNKANVRTLTPYLFGGLFLWLALHETGIHATLSGVLLAAFVPLRIHDSVLEKRSPLKSLEHTLHPFVVYAVMPLFALANAGISFEGITPHTFLDPIAAGILLGLFIGKPLGVLAASWLAVRTGFARLPKAVTWAQLCGVAFLCGIGFTMALFIGVLAFDAPENMSAVRLGVLSASALSACVGLGLLYALSGLAVTSQAQK